MDTLVHHIQVFDDSKGRIKKVTISAFCQICGNRRGDPIKRKIIISGNAYLVDMWDNPCGHPDDVKGVLDEVESQCALDYCTVLASDTYHPYCSEPCFSQAGREIASHVRIVGRQLGASIAIIMGLKDVFKRADMESPAMDRMASLIGIAQDVLLEASSMSPEMYLNFWA